MRVVVRLHRAPCAARRAGWPRDGAGGRVLESARWRRTALDL